MSKNEKAQENILKERGRNLSAVVLLEKRMPKEELQNAWNAKNFTAEDMLYFTSTNKKYLDFLAISYRQVGMSLYLHPDKYIGCVPFVSPITGTKTGNLEVKGRFGEDISELLSVVGEGVDIEYEPHYLLRQESTIKPPLYFVCQQYIDKFIEAKKIHWQKFVNIEKIQSFPTASTRWDKYAEWSADVRNLLRYPNRVNLLSTEHAEWRELLYILDFCIQELQSVRTPSRSRAPYAGKISSLAQTYSKSELKYTKEMKVHMTDPAVIKDLKGIGNKILNASNGVSCAWRLDLSVFFERYVQYLFGQIARTHGIQLMKNPHYRISGQIPSFGLKYIEPDVILEKNGIQYIVDAKYKMYMKIYYQKSDDLYNDFRDDLHQVLSYAAFGTKQTKNCIIVTPCESDKDPYVKTFEIMNPYNGCNCKFHMVAIPLTKVRMKDSIEFLSDLLDFDSDSGSDD